MKKLVKHSLLALVFASAATSVVQANEAQEEVAVQEQQEEATRKCGCSSSCSSCNK